jgi:hypothetical protein
MRITIDQAGESWRISVTDYVPKDARTEADALKAALALFTSNPPTSILWLDDARVSGLQERVRKLEAVVGSAAEPAIHAADPAPVALPPPGDGFVYTD